MSKSAQQSPCPFVVQLVAMLLEEQSSQSGCCGSSMFSRLLDLEADAKNWDAPEASRQLIARVRRIAGTATVIRFPGRFSLASQCSRVR